MASYLVQAGSSLYHVSTAGVATAVTLPTGITLTGSTRPCRYVLFGSGNNAYVIVVKGANHDFYIDTLGTARRLQLAPPSGTPTLAAGASTGLTGVYKAAITFKVKTAEGTIISESPMSPLSVASAALANQSLRLNNIPVSPDAVVNARGVYRTLASGNVLYPWYDIDDNVTTSEDRAGADSLISLLPTTATSISSPPDLDLIASWRERLWGVPRYKNDAVRWTEERQFYAWNQSNELIAPPQNTDSYGVTALIPRRDNLGICRRHHTYMISGNSNDTFQRIGISESLGCVSQESVVVINNVAYMLGEYGVNEWSDLGVRSVSDGQVDAWFSTDLYFNRAQFPKAQGRYNPDTDSYELLLCSVDSTSLDRWVAYQLSSRTWLGPHKTDAFTPTSAATDSTFRGMLTDANSLLITAFGGDDGFIYVRDRDVISDSGTAVPFSIALPYLSASEPDYDKYFDQPTIHTRAEDQGTLTITPIVGGLTATASTPLYHDLTLDRDTLDRLGQGRYCQLTLTHSSLYERPRIYGIEIPYAFVGRR